MKTLKSLVHEACVTHSERIAFTHKERKLWTDTSYGEFLNAVNGLSSLLAKLGVQPGERVGLLRENSPEWAMTYFAIVSCGAVAVPIDVSLQEKEVLHILNDAEVKVLFSEKRSGRLLQDVLPKAQTLETVVLKKAGDTSYDNIAELFDFDAALADMAGVEPPEYEPQPNDLASLIYTSGTTGRQKGAMLTHGNFCSNLEGVLEALGNVVVADDHFLTVLPLHHSFSFMGNLLLPISCGARMSYVESLRTVSANMLELQPSIFMGVPLLFEKMHDRIMQGIKKRAVTRLLYTSGIHAPIAKGVQKKLGGSLRLMITGGAPCSTTVIKGFNKLGFKIVEGYGLTETSPVLTFNHPERSRPGTVGQALPNVELKIVNQNAEGIGEIAARGPNVMQGYYKNAEYSAEVMQEDFFLTGDLGRIDNDGYLMITGRKKSLIVNREGKNIYPEEVEAQINASPFILESLLLGYQEEGDEVGERLGLIVVPDTESLDAEEKRTGKTLSDVEVETLVLAEVKKMAQQLASYKRPRRIQVRAEEFQKTSTKKVKRYLYSMGVHTLEA